MVTHRIVAFNVEISVVRRQTFREDVESHLQIAVLTHAHRATQHDPAAMGDDRSCACVWRHSLQRRAVLI